MNYYSRTGTPSRRGDQTDGTEEIRGGEEDARGSRAQGQRTGSQEEEARGGREEEAGYDEAQREFHCDNKNAFHQLNPELQI